MSCGSGVPFVRRRSERALPLRVICVLEEVERFGDTTGAQVQGQHRLDAGQATPAHELVQPEGVRLTGVPGQIEARRALLHWPDAILPAVARKQSCRPGSAPR